MGVFKPSWEKSPRCARRAFAFQRGLDAGVLAGQGLGAARRQDGYHDLVRAGWCGQAVERPLDGRDPKPRLGLRNYELVVGRGDGEPFPERVELRL